MGHRYGVSFCDDLRSVVSRWTCVERCMLVACSKYFEHIQRLNGELGVAFRG
jgi:hypothetical protein